MLVARRPRVAVEPHPIESAYVDSALCAGCHGEIAKSYRQTGMGRSLYRPRPANRVEDYRVHNTLHHRPSDLTYTMIERDGAFYQRRSQTGFEGKETNVVEKRVDYVIGSGNHARSYLFRDPEGKLIEMPVTWYSEKGGYWAMSPGYDRPEQQDFRRAVAEDCLFCHNGFAVGEEIPQGIDCQRCHGPGREHVELAGSGKALPDAIRRAIVNPKRLERDRQLEVCMQCHLEPTSRPLPHVISRFEGEPFAYKPGRPLGKSFLFFDHAPGTGHDDDFEIAHAAYRLRKSKCFQASAMTCITCHNPHQIPRGAEAVRHYEAACRTCHQAAHASGVPAGGTCMDCHMPRRRAEDAVHVVMTDHYIQRRKPSRDLVAPIAERREPPYRGEVVPYYPQAPADELYVAVAQVRDGANLQAGIPRLRAAIEKLKPAAPEFSFELGRAWIKAGNYGEAIASLEEALRKQPDYQPAVKEMAVALTATGDLARAAELLEQAAARPGADAVILSDLGNVYLRQGRLDAAQQALRKASERNPELPEAANLQGLAALQAGDAAGAERHFREAIRLQPDLAEAHYNLGNLLAARRDYPQARYHFEKAIAANPEYAAAHHRYGLVLILLRSYDQALAELRESVRIDPNLAQAQNDLADLLSAQGKTAEAERHYELARKALH